MALNIQQFREKYPQFTDVNDVDLARSLHQRFSPDTSYGVFERNFLGSITSFPSRRRIESPDIDFYGPQQLLTSDVETPTFFKSLEQEIPQTVGGEVGALAGGVVGSAFGPVGTVAGAVIGAGIGGMGGKGYQQAYKMITDPTDAPSGFGEIYGAQAIAGAEELVAEGVGRGGMAFIGKWLAKPSATLAPDAMRINAKLRDAATRMPTKDLSPYAKRLLRRGGVHTTAGQRTVSKLKDFTETAVESTIFGGNRLFHQKNILQPPAFKQYAKETAETFWEEAGKRMSDTELGESFIADITGKKLGARRVHRMMYNEVDVLSEDMAKQVFTTRQVPSAILDEFGQPLTKEVTTSKMVAIDLSAVHKEADIILKEVKPSGAMGSAQGIRKIANKVKKWDTTADGFLSAHDMQSNLLEEARKIQGRTGAKQPKVDRAAKRLANKMKEVIEEAAGRHSPQLLETVKRADAMVAKDYADILDNEMINSAMRAAQKRPHVIAQTVFKPKGYKTAKLIKDTVDDKTFKSLVAGWLENQMKPTKEGINWAVTFNDKVNNMGDDMLKLMFPDPKHLEDVLDIGRMGTIVRTPVGGGGGMVAQLTQAGAIIDLAIGIPAGQPMKRGSSLILIGPAVVGRIMASPTGADLLSSGVKISANAPGAAGLATRLASLIRRTHQEMQNEQKEPRKKQVNFPRFGRHF